MMDIQVLASSSTGNCYRVSDGHTNILLECGISMQKIREGLDFRLSDITACFVSHEHQDHARAVKDIAKAGIDVYMSLGTWEALGVKHHRVRSIQERQLVPVGSFWLMAFDAQHDARQPFGYILYSRRTGEKLLFATDTYYIRYRFQGLTHIMVECNYAKDILDANVEAGLVPETLKNRLLESHMELETCKGFFRANDLSKVKEIYLLHLSAGNSDAERFRREIQELTGKEVYICGRSEMDKDYNRYV